MYVERVVLPACYLRADEIARHLLDQRHDRLVPIQQGLGTLQAAGTLLWVGLLQCQIERRLELTARLAA